MELSHEYRWLGLLLLAWTLCAQTGGAVAQEAGDASGKRYAAAVAVQNRGESAYAKGNKPQAAQLYAEAAAIFAEVAATPGSEHAAPARLAQGKCLYLAGKFADARKLLAECLNGGGDAGLEAVHWLARTLLKEGKPDEALAVVEKALPQIGQSELAPWLLMDQADAALEVPQRRKDAAGLYAAFAAKYPKDTAAPQAQYMAGFAAMQTGDYAAAGQHARQFLAALPEHELALDARCIAAEAALQSKQFAEAERSFADLIAKHVGHRDADSWKARSGLAMFLQQKYPEAIATLQSALAGLKTPDAIAEAQFLIGSSQAELKQWDAAVKAFEASVAASPKWRQAEDALALVAQSYDQLKNPAKAKAAYSRLVADWPESRHADQAHYRLGEVAFAAGDWKTAAAEYQQVIDKHPQSTYVPLALYGLGWTGLSAKDYDTAEKAFGALLEKHPGHKLAAKGRYARGVARQQLGKFAPAMEDLKAFLAAGPAAAEKTEARYALGLCHYGVKQLAEAVKVYRELLQDDPNSPIADKVYYDLGWALKEAGQEKEAAESFAAVVAARPDGPLATESRHHVGEFAYRSGDFTKAAANYYAALQGAGKTELGEKAAHKLGWAYYRLDNLNDARQTFAYQRVTWPQGQLYSDAAFMEGECCLKQKMFDAAIKAYDQVKTPTVEDFSVLARLHKADALGRLKKWEQSIRVLAELIEQSPDAPCVLDAIYEQGMAQKNLGRMAEAQGLFEKVIAKSTTDREATAKAQFMIGEIQFDQKKYQAAFESFIKVAYGYGYPKWQAVAMYEAGRSCEAMGKKDEAVRQYRDLAEKFPESDETPLAKDRLKALVK